MPHTYDMSRSRQTAKLAGECPLDGVVGRHFVAARTSPCLDMTDAKAALSGGPPALTTAATSLKYWLFR